MIESDDDLCQSGFRLGNRCARASHRRRQPGNRQAQGIRRSTAAALWQHMPRMPVATVRVWERHGLTQRERSSSPFGRQRAPVGVGRGADGPRSRHREPGTAGHAAAAARGHHACARAGCHTERRALGCGPLAPVRAWRLAVIGAAMGPGCSGPRCCAGMASPCCRWGRSTTLRRPPPRCGSRSSTSC